MVDPLDSQDVSVRSNLERAEAEFAKDTSSYVRSLCKEWRYPVHLDILKLVPRL